MLGVTAVVSLKDPKQAAATQARLLELFHQGTQAAEQQADEDAGPYRRYRLPPRIEPVEFSGRTIYVFDGGARDFPFAPAWCLTDKEFVVAVGAQSIKAYLCARPISNRWPECRRWQRPARQRRPGGPELL